MTDKELMIIRGCIACGLSNEDILKYLTTGESATTSTDKKFDKEGWKKELATICGRMEKATSSQELENIYSGNFNRFAKSNVYTNCHSKCQKKFSNYTPF